MTYTDLHRPTEDELDTGDLSLVCFYSVAWVLKFSCQNNSLVFHNFDIYLNFVNNQTRKQKNLISQNLKMQNKCETRLFKM